MRSIYFVVVVIALLYYNFGDSFLVKGMNHRNDLILSLLSKEQNGMSKDHSYDKITTSSVATNLSSSNQISDGSSNKINTFKRFEKDNKKSLRLLVNGLSQLKRKDF